MPHVAVSVAATGVVFPAVMVVDVVVVAAVASIEGLVHGAVVDVLGAAACLLPPRNNSKCEIFTKSQLLLCLPSCRRQDLSLQWCSPGLPIFKPSILEASAALCCSSPL